MITIKFKITIMIATVIKRQIVIINNQLTIQPDCVPNIASIRLINFNGIKMYQNAIK